MRELIVMKVFSFCADESEGVHLQANQVRLTNDYDSIIVSLPVEFHESVNMTIFLKPWGGRF